MRQQDGAARQAENIECHRPRFPVPCRPALLLPATSYLPPLPTKRHLYCRRRRLPAPGGELFTHLRSRGRLSEEGARFYAAEVLTVLEYLHGRGIAYRDLKVRRVRVLTLS